LYEREAGVGAGATDRALDLVDRTCARAPGRDRPLPWAISRGSEGTRAPHHAASLYAPDYQNSIASISINRRTPWKPLEWASGWSALWSGRVDVGHSPTLAGPWCRLTGSRTSASLVREHFGRASQCSTTLVHSCTNQLPGRTPSRPTSRVDCDARASLDLGLAVKRRYRSYLAPMP